MRYKNVSVSNVKISEYKYLAPGAEIELDDEQVKNPEIRSMIKDFGWLTSVFEDVGETFILGEIDHITGNNPPAENININIPLKSKVKIVNDKVYISTSLKHLPTPAEHALDEATKQKAIEDAIGRASQNKRTWNPMDDAAPEGEPDFLGVLHHVNTATQYGNAEIALDAQLHPKTHMGGSEFDDADSKPMGDASYVPHHPEDTAKYHNQFKDEPTKLPVKRASRKK